MITAMVRLSHFEKVLLKPEFAEVQAREVLDNFSGSDKLISEYFESKFHLRSCWPFQCYSSFFKKMKPFLVRLLFELRQTG